MIELLFPVATVFVGVVTLVAAVRVMRESGKNMDDTREWLNEIEADNKRTERVLKYVKFAEHVATGRCDDPVQCALEALTDTAGE